MSKNPQTVEELLADETDHRELPTPEELHSQGNLDPDKTLQSLLVQMVKRSDALHARSMQTKIGPSEVGNPCDRSLGFAVRDREGEPVMPLRTSDPIPKIVGTAVHSWLEAAANLDNDIERTVVGLDLWKTEAKVNITHPDYSIDGHCDLYDTGTNTVIDWKIVGATSYRNYTRDGLAQIYRVQSHLYGLGYKQAGYDVQRVAIALLPRNGPLRDLRVIGEPFDEQLAKDSLTRLARIAKGDHWLNQPPSPSNTNCRWCDVPLALCPDSEEYR